MKFHLLLSDEMPVQADKIYDSLADSVEVRRARLTGDLAIECIHAHAFLNALNVKTGVNPQFDKIKDFVLNRFIKKTAQLRNDLDMKQTLTSSVRHGLENLKNDCERPEVQETLARLCLDSATKYEDLLNADIVYLATHEKIKFAQYVNHKDLGFSTILTRDVSGENDSEILREKVIALCERWIDALYSDLAKKTSPKKGGGMWSGWTSDEHRGRSWVVWACDTVGDALITMGNYIKVSTPNKTETTSDDDGIEP